jgi:hypothetical protein
MWANYRGSLAAPTDGWKHRHDDRLYRVAIQKMKAEGAK